MENNTEKKTVDFKIEDEFNFERNGFAIIKDLCELRGLLKALIDETFDLYAAYSDISAPAGTALYGVDSNITEAIGEILHAEYEAGRLRFLSNAPNAAEANAAPCNPPSSLDTPKALEEASSSVDRHEALASRIYGNEGAAQ